LIASHVDMRRSKRALNTWERGMRRRGSCSGEEMMGGGRGDESRSGKARGSAHRGFGVAEDNPGELAACLESCRSLGCALNSVSDARRWRRRETYVEGLREEKGKGVQVHGHTTLTRPTAMSCTPNASSCGFSWPSSYLRIVSHFFAVGRRA
jgi:hypothetical protein